jgi:carboxymethylenebutenolidase
MAERHVGLTTPQGVMDTFIAHPEGDGPYPVVLFYMDAPAIREELYDMARRIAAQGYYVMLPDLFYRFGVLRFPLRNARSRAIWRAAMADMSNAEVMDDTRAMLAHVDADPAARGGKLACIGFCMSGRLVVSAAGTFPERVAVISSLYGVGIVTGKDDSPHLLAPRIKARCHFAFAEIDDTVPSYVVPTLEAALREHDVEHRLDVWPGTAHGFSFASRDVYHAEAAEACWQIFFDLCRESLAAPG